MLLQQARAGQRPKVAEVAFRIADLALQYEIGWPVARLARRRRVEVIRIARKQRNALARRRSEGGRDTLL